MVAIFFAIGFIIFLLYAFQLDFLAVLAIGGILAFIGVSAILVIDGCAKRQARRTLGAAWRRSRTRKSAL